MADPAHLEADLAMAEQRIQELEQERDHALELASQREADLEACLHDVVALEGKLTEVAGEVEELQKLFGLVLSKRRKA